MLDNIKRKEKLIILTCGGTGREIAELTQHSYDLLGFLDDSKKEIGVLGTLGDFHQFIGIAKFCSGLGNYRSMLRRKNILDNIPIEEFITFIDTSSRIYTSAKVRQGVTVFPNSIISSGAILNNHVLIYHNCVIAHDAFIDEYSIIANSVCISGGANVGSNCYIGAGVNILEGIKIGNNCIIAAGATVISHVKDNTIYISPKKMKENPYL